MNMKCNLAQQYRHGERLRREVFNLVSWVLDHAPDSFVAIASRDMQVLWPFEKLCVCLQNVVDVAVMGLGTKKGGRLPVPDTIHHTQHHPQTTNNAKYVHGHIGACTYGFKAIGKGA